MLRPDLHVAVYGDVNLNLIDGSAIWAQSVVEALSGAGCQVQLLLKARIMTHRLTDHMARLPGVTLVRAIEDGLVRGAGDALTPGQAAAALAELDDATRFDVLVLRGFRFVREMAAQERFRGRLWTYLTDVPQSLDELNGTTREQLAEVAAASQFLLCQTEELRGFLESTIPEACGKCLLFPPIVPPGDRQRSADPPPTPSRLRLVYTGKFAPRWNTLPMTELPAALAGRGITAELHAVGDKVHRDAAHPEFHDRMRRALEHAPGVVWHGGVSRQEAMRLAAEADVGMSWRDADLDTSLELSTKVLEFGAVGLPVVLNRTRVHEDLLGVDYPLFANAWAEVLDVLERAATDPATWSSAAARCRDAARGFALDRAVARVATYLERGRPRGRVVGGRRRRVLVASHDLKFFSRILEHLEALPHLEVRIDRWESLSTHDERASRELLEWADVVVCEWCGPNAIWYSQRVRSDQRLVVRLHRFELEAGYGERMDIDAVDQVVCVSPHYAQLTRETLGWPADKVVTIPNWVDLLQFDRPKYPGARFHLGMIGIAPSRKRMDLGLDVLEELRATDERYLLFVKTRMPWEYWWIWKHDAERAHFEDIFRRIQTSDLLRGAVVFDAYGGDVAAWLRKIGFVLSTSDDESFHLSPAEGMASRAVPVIRDWPGAQTIYADEWIYSTPGEMALAVLAHRSAPAWDQAALRGYEQIRAGYSLDGVCSLWERVVDADLPVDQAGAVTTGTVEWNGRTMVNERSAPSLGNLGERVAALRRKAASDGAPAAATAAVRAVQRRGIAALRGPGPTRRKVALDDGPRSFRLDLPRPRGGGAKALQIRCPRGLYIPAALERDGLGGYEPDTVACVLALLDIEPDVPFFDVGANVGVFALVAAAAGSASEVVAFEPEPMLADVLQGLADANGLAVAVERCALGDREGEATLFLSDVTDTSHSLAEGFRPSQRHVTVPVETLDAYCARTGRWPRVVKIDTESTEPAVLAGASTLLREHRPWIVCEVLAGRSERSLERVLEPHGYTWYQLTGEVPPVARREIFGDRSHTYTNWLLTPEAPGDALWTAVRERRAQLAGLARLPR